jgi:hypothetical protein
MIWNCAGKTRTIWIAWARHGFPIRPPPATSRGAFKRRTASRCRSVLTARASGSAPNHPEVSRPRPMSRWTGPAPELWANAKGA